MTIQDVDILGFQAVSFLGCKLWGGLRRNQSKLRCKMANEDRFANTMRAGAQHGDLLSNGFEPIAHRAVADAPFSDRLLKFWHMGRNVARSGRQ